MQRLTYYFPPNLLLIQSSNKAAIANQKEEEKFENCEPLKFEVNDQEVVMDLWLPPYDQKVDNTDVREFQSKIECALRKSIRSHLDRYYRNTLKCECNFRTTRIPIKYT